MPSLFAALAFAASATVDAVYAEGFVLEPRAAPEISAPLLANGRPDVNARSVSSTTRAGVAFQGVYVAAGATIHAHGRGMADSTTRATITDRPMIDVDVRSLPQRPQRDDVIVRNDTGERFRVADPWDALDLGRVRIWLTPL